MQYRVSLAEYKRTFGFDLQIRIKSNNTTEVQPQAVIKFKLLNGWAYTAIVH